MGYYTRAFCTSSEIPTLPDLRKQVQAIHREYRIESGEGNLDNDWESFELFYKEGKLPLLVELNKRNHEDNLANEEIEEFIEDIGAPLFSLSKRKVINHLMKTKYI